MKSHDLKDIRKRLEAGRFQEVIAQVASILHNNPPDAQAWLYLAQALENTRHRSLGWLAYERAWILDPQAKWVDQVRPRFQRTISNKQIPSWFRDLLKVPKVSLTAAMIACNEERSIQQTLEAVAPAVDDIVVVDTGSDDHTATIAKRLGASVYATSWNDDFSAARNFAMTHVKTDWVLWIDADEILDPEDIKVPRLVAGLFHRYDPPLTLRVVLINDLGGSKEYNFDVSRLFPTRFGLRFWGRIHEQIGPPVGGIYKTAYHHPLVRIRLHHDGYDPSRLPQKLERNIRILRLALNDNPDDVISWGFLGRELYVQGNLEDAVNALYRAEKLAQDIETYGRVPELRTYLVDALIRLGRLDEATAVSLRAIEDSPNFPPALYGYGKAQLMMALKLSESARRALVATREKAPEYQGMITYDPQVPGWKSLVALADVAKIQGDWTTAVSLYDEARRQQAPAQAIDIPLQHIREQIAQLQSILSAQEPPNS